MQRVGRKGCHIKIPSASPWGTEPLQHCFSPSRAFNTYEEAGCPSFPGSPRLSCPVWNAYLSLPPWDQVWPRDCPTAILHRPGSPPSFWFQPPLSSSAQPRRSTDTYVLICTKYSISPCIWYRLQILQRYESYLLWSIMSTSYMSPRIKGESLQRVSTFRSLAFLEEPAEHPKDPEFLFWLF